MPLPEGPSNAVIVPGSSCIETPSTALNKPLRVLKCLTMLLTSTRAPRTGVKFILGEDEEDDDEEGIFSSLAVLSVSTMS